MNSTLTDVDTVQAMIRYGGSFVRKLGDAMLCADADNLARLKAAYPELMEKYADVARLHAKRNPPWDRAVELD